MTIEKHPNQTGIDVHLEPAECELFLRLALDAEKASDGGEASRRYAEPELSYFSISLALGQKIRALIGPDIRVDPAL